MRVHQTFARRSASAFTPATLPALAQEKSIVVASTTSTQDSGLFGHILPHVQGQDRHRREGHRAGHGPGARHRPPRRCRRGVRARQGAGGKVRRRGLRREALRRHVQRLRPDRPESDPAKIKGGKDVLAGLKAINDTGSPFVSRGDKSGTHSAELALWKAAGLDPASTKPAWYREIGQGMGAALNTAGAMGGYVLSDRGTWISFKNKGDLEIAVEGDKRLFNQYGIILVNPAKHPQREEGAGPGVHRLGRVGARDRTPSVTTRSRASAVLPQCRPGQLRVGGWRLRNHHSAAVFCARLKWAVGTSQGRLVQSLQKGAGRAAGLD